MQLFHISQLQKKQNCMTEFFISFHFRKKLLYKINIKTNSSHFFCSLVILSEFWVILSEFIKWWVLSMIKWLTDPTKKSLKEQFWNDNHPKKIKTYFYWRSDQCRCILLNSWPAAGLTVNTGALSVHQRWREHRSGDDDAVQQVQTQQVPQEHEVGLDPDPKLTWAADRIRLTSLIITDSPTYNTLTVSHLRSYGACDSTATVLIWPRPHAPLSAALWSPGSASTSPRSQCCVSGAAAGLWLEQTAGQKSETDTWWQYFFWPCAIFTFSLISEFFSYHGIKKMVSNGNGVQAACFIFYFVISQVVSA